MNEKLVILDYSQLTDNQKKDAVYINYEKLKEDIITEFIDEVLVDRSVFTERMIEMLDIESKIREEVIDEITSNNLITTIEDVCAVGHSYYLGAIDDCIQAVKKDCMIDCATALEVSRVLKQLKENYKEK